MMVGVPVLLVAFVKWSLKSACFSDEAFFLIKSIEDYVKIYFLKC